jgi:hypothetical protein
MSCWEGVSYPLPTLVAWIIVYFPGALTLTRTGALMLPHTAHSRTPVTRTAAQQGEFTGGSSALLTDGAGQ